MINELKSEIVEALKNLAKGAENQSLENLIGPIEQLYEKVLIADYLERRMLRRQRVQKSVLKNLESALEITETSIAIPEEKAPEKEEVAPKKSYEEPREVFNPHPEIVVVPHPEGPPAMHIEEEPMLQQVVEPKKVVDFVPPAAPKVAVPQVEVEAPRAAPVVAAPEAPKHTTLPTFAIVEPEVAAPKTTVGERAQTAPKKTSLHERLSSKTLSFGLNDRLAFVKHLFDGNNEDFNRVVSQLNTYESWQEAASFLNEMVKPDYNWEKSAEYAARFEESVRARFEA